MTCAVVASILALTSAFSALSVAAFLVVAESALALIG